MANLLHFDLNLHIEIKSSSVPLVPWFLFATQLPTRPDLTLLLRLKGWSKIEVRMLETVGKNQDLQEEEDSPAQQFQNRLDQQQEELRDIGEPPSLPSRS